MQFIEALEKGTELQFLKQFKSYDYPNGEWIAELIFTLDFPGWRYCYFAAQEPANLKGSKYRLMVRKDQGYKPSDDSDCMAHSDSGIFRLETAPDDKTMGKWLKAKCVE